MKMKMKMKKKLTLLLAFALVLSMIPAPASAALKSAGSPTEVQALVSSENVEHNFVKVTANGMLIIHQKYLHIITPLFHPGIHCQTHGK